MKLKLFTIISILLTIASSTYFFKSMFAKTFYLEQTSVHVANPVKFDLLSIQIDTHYVDGSKVNQMVNWVTISTVPFWLALIFFGISIFCILGMLGYKVVRQ